MKYTKLRIKNFKGIKELELDLDKNPKSKIFTLVGLNESGKTSILEAINLLQNKVGDEDAHKMIHKSQQFNFNGKIVIGSELELDEKDEEEIKKYCKDNFKFKLSEPIEKVKISKIYSFNNSKKKDYTSEWKINLKGKKTGNKDVDMYSKYSEEWEKVVGYIENSFFPKILYYENFYLISLKEYILKNEKTTQKNKKNIVKFCKIF